ncbi:MAG TPA: paraquat-inducible protein A [Kiloniellales bacterium]|nr:paraquat-inducible protein A [Kiloniellales bacterium]
MPQPMPPPTSTLAIRLPRHPRSLAARAQGADRLLGPFFLLVSVLLIAGWLLPIMTVRKLVFFTEPISILEGTAALWRADQIFLFLVIALFSIVFPAAKMLLALGLWYGADATNPNIARTLDWLEAFGRWSMLDVFVVALSIVAIQLSIVSDVATHAGLYVFTAAVVLSMIGVRRAVVLARRAHALPRNAVGG